jgi:uncharacterized membrane protein YccC
MAKENSLWTQIITFDKSKMEAWVGFRSGLGVALAMLIGNFLSSPAAGLAIAIGALNVCYSDRSDSYSTRGKRMLTAAFFSSLAVFAGAASANNPALFFVLLTMITFFCGMLVVVDNVAADIGVVVVATYLIFSAQALTPLMALELSLYAFMGGVLQALISVALWPLRKYKPERRALSNLYFEIASLAIDAGSAMSTPAGSAQSIETQTQLATLAGDTDAEARRYRSLLSQAERLRITVLSLNRLGRRLTREGKAHHSVTLLNESLRLVAELLEAVAKVINFGLVRGVAPKYMAEIQERIDKIREDRSHEESPFYAAVLKDLVYQLEAMAGQLRAIVELTEKTTLEGMEAAAKKESEKPLHLRYWSGLASIRANLTFQSPGFRHAVRLAVCMIVGEILSHILKIARPYWLPMTIAVVLKPDYAATFNRSFLRVVGTLIGLVIATFLFHYLPSGPWAAVALIFTFTFLVRWAGSGNYGVFAMCVSGLVVVLIALTGVAPKDVIWSRGINTLVGGTVALVIYWLWPTSEKLQLAEVMARMLEGYRDYLHVVVRKNVDPVEVDRIRQRSRVARANFNEASGRFNLERSADVEDMKVLSAVTVATNRFAHASMSLEAGTQRELSEVQKKGFLFFAEQVEKTLDLLADALRGRDVPHNEFPDVRAAYLELVKTQANASQAYSFVFFEADRMTNSLNTLTEYVLKYLHRKRGQKKM